MLYVAAALAVCACAASASPLPLYVGFEEASASNTHSAGAFGAKEALTKGSGYWCSSGKHAPGQQVTWQGSLGARQKAVGLKLDWAYAPGEYKILTSSDGGNFEEAACWQTSKRPDVSYQEVVMFTTPHSVKAVMVVMRSPQPWGYFGLSSVALMVEPGPVMVVAGGAAAGGEECLISQGKKVYAIGCLDGIAAGAGGDIFNFNADNQLVSSSSGECVVAEVGSSSVMGLTMEDCVSSLEANDGRSVFSLTSSGQLKLSNLGDYCLSVNGGNAVVEQCRESVVPAGQKFFLTAVPEWDPAPTAYAQDLASMLKAAEARHSTLVAELKVATAKCKGSP